MNREYQQGIIVEKSHQYFLVSMDDNSLLLCVLRGKLKRGKIFDFKGKATAPARRILKNNQQETPDEAPQDRYHITVGDRVLVTVIDKESGVIEDVQPRISKFSRAKAESVDEKILLANLDTVCVIFSVNDPYPNFNLLDRFLALAENNKIPALICFNKIDLHIPSDVQKMIDIYQNIGYEVILSSAYTNSGFSNLTDAFGNMTLICGPSGVGKSSIINIIVPGAQQKTAEISKATLQGRQTTTGVRLFRMESGKWIADSAGISDLQFWKLPSDEIAGAFRDLQPFLDDCKYADCAHDGAAEFCAVRDAVAAGKISEERYDSYLTLIAEPSAE